MIYFHLCVGWNEMIYLLGLSLEFGMRSFLTRDAIMYHFRRETQWCWSSCCSCSPTYLVSTYKPSVTATMILYLISVLTLSCSCRTGCNHFVSTLLAKVGRGYRGLSKVYSLTLCFKSSTWDHIYMVKRRRCVWNKTFLLVPLYGIRPFHAQFQHFS